MFIDSVDGEEDPMDAQIENERSERKEETAVVQSTSLLSPQLKAMIRIKKKYLKRLHTDHGSNSARLGLNSSSCVISDGSQPKRPKRKSKRRVLFPNHTHVFKPKKERNRSKHFLMFFSVIIFLQVKSTFVFC